MDKRLPRVFKDAVACLQSQTGRRAKPRFRIGIVARRLLHRAML